MYGIPGFEKSFVETNGIKIAVHTGGRGPCLVLLHGFPQNHMCWSKIATALSRSYRCLIPDLRGYGESDAPKDTAPYQGYSKRNMAIDITGMLDAFGIEKASIVGHDRGARVAYRLALDSPHRVDRIVILEVVPTGELWRCWNAELAYNAYHWTFLAQPAPLPERMISADPVAYMDWTLASWTLSRSLEPFSRAALDSYRLQAKDPNRIAAMCSDYRAGAGIDRAIDEEDRKVGRKIAAPLHFIWSESGFPNQTGDPMGIWQSMCEQLTGESIPDCGHFIIEENPHGLLPKITKFLNKAR